MNNKESFEKLKHLLEGKTISKIEPPEASEAICKFVMEDGSAFRLHATELGFWTEETIGIDNRFYKNLDQLIIDYDHYTYVLKPSYNYNLPAAKIVITHDVFSSEDVEEIINFIAPDNKSFSIKSKNLSKEELKIVRDPEGIKILSDAANMGVCWRMFFGKNYDCPEHLKLVPLES